MSDNNVFSLKGKTVLVTGASSGIGACTAIECSKAGATVILTGRNTERLNDTLSKMEGQGHRALPFDLCEVEKFDQFVSELPVLDGVSFCAGITKSVPVKNMKDVDIESIFNTNILSLMKLSKLLLKGKKLSGGASVVFISSIATAYAAMGNAIYAASKGAVNSFAKVMALELAPKKIRVNCIQPGIVLTNIQTNSFTQEQFAQEESKYPLGFGEPVDIANGIIYFLSDASKWTTGTILNIDGGVTLL